MAAAPQPTAESVLQEMNQLLHGMRPSEVLSGLHREEQNLKQLKNALLEEMDRVQLEALLLRRQLEELQNPNHQEQKQQQQQHRQQQQEADVDSHALATEGDSDEHLRMLIEDDLAQIAAASATGGTPAEAAGDATHSHAYRIGNSGPANEQR